MSRVETLARFCVQAKRRWIDYLPRVEGAFCIYLRYGVSFGQRRALLSYADRTRRHLASHTSTRYTLMRRGEVALRRSVVRTYWLYFECLNRGEACILDAVLRWAITGKISSVASYFGMSPDSATTLLRPYRDVFKEAERAADAAAPSRSTFWFEQYKEEVGL